jgi:cytochrome P450
MTFNCELMIIASDDPYQTYKWMRDNDPAHYFEVEDIWVLTRYADVSATFENWKGWLQWRRRALNHDQLARLRSCR